MECWVIRRMKRSYGPIGPIARPMQDMSHGPRRPQGTCSSLHEVRLALVPASPVVAIVLPVNESLDNVTVVVQLDAEPPPSGGGTCSNNLFAEIIPSLDLHTCRT